MSDLDKDIEIVKEVQGIFEHLKNHGWVNDLKREVDIDKVVPAISRIIDYVNYAELTKIACCTAQNCEALNNAIRLGKELETYKKANDNLLVKNAELKIGLKTLEQSNKNLLAKKTELETWKKIAEKLAEEVKKEILHYDVQGINYCELSYENDYTKHGKCSKHNNGASCVQCIIDWARKEVENEQ